MHRYRGFIADSARWWDFTLRADDVVITTPSKCGTTWMQAIVGMLLFDRVRLGQPMGLVSPWLDMLTRTKEEVFGLLDAQTHRRFVKTHTPLDGLPRHETVTYLAVVRHPLDAALSNRDHNENMDAERTLALKSAARGVDAVDELPALESPDELGAYLRWWIDDETPARGTGLTNLAEFAHQVVTYWDGRERPNVHLFHYEDLERDLEGEMRQVAAALGTAVDVEHWPELVAAARLDAMRGRADELVPEAHLQLWHSVPSFFKQGGRRAWASLLGPDDLAHFDERLLELAGPGVVDWIRRGRAALDGDMPGP